MSNILRHHFIMPSARFSQHREEPSPSVVVKPITCSVKAIQDRVGSIEYGWIGKDTLYSDEALEARLHEIELLDLYDINLSDSTPIGYTIITCPTHIKAFNAAANNESVIEIENLAFYEGHRGHGKGWQYFTKVMDKLFEQYDNVYWSQSETNHPTLAEYYKRKGMVYLGTDEQEDFRPSAPNTKLLANIA